MVTQTLDLFDSVSKVKIYFVCNFLNKYTFKKCHKYLILDFLTWIFQLKETKIPTKINGIL